jgi:very-short-patch-repair endonuclease
VKDLIWGPYDIQIPEKEYRFHDKRRWRFDYCWPDKKLAVEIDGGIWSQGRHARGYGIIKDNEKINEAQKLGYRVFRFTPQQLKTGEAQTFIKKVMEGS